MVNTITTNGMNFAFAHHGYVYLRSYNIPYSVYKFEIGSSANVVKITTKGMSNIDCSPFMAYEGRIYWVSCFDCTTITKIGELCKTGILASISAVQFILESDYEKSELAQNINNCFGMKCSLFYDVGNCKYATLHLTYFNKLTQINRLIEDFKAKKV